MANTYTPLYIQQVFAVRYVSNQARITKLRIAAKPQVENLNFSTVGDCKSHRAVQFFIFFYYVGASRVWTVL